VRRFVLFASESEDGLLVLTEEAKTILAALGAAGSLKTVVVCVIGEARTGKSTILSCTAAKLIGMAGTYESTTEADAIFPSCDGHLSHTKGIHAALVTTRTASGEPCNVLLLDAEGEGQGDDLRAKTLSAAACALSNVVVMNIQGQLNARFCEEHLCPVARAVRSLNGDQAAQQRCMVLLRDNSNYKTEAEAIGVAFQGDMADVFEQRSCALCSHPATPEGRASVEAAADALVGHIRAAAEVSHTMDLPRAVHGLAEILESDAFRESMDLSLVGRRLRAKLLESKAEYCALSGKQAWFDPIEARVVFDWADAGQRDRLQPHVSLDGGVQVVSAVVEREVLVARLEALTPAEAAALPESVMSLDDARTKSTRHTVLGNHIGDARQIIATTGWAGLETRAGLFFSRRAHASLLAAVAAGDDTVEGEVRWDPASMENMPDEPLTVAELIERDPRMAPLEA